jgi:hypothetical protein
MAFIYGGWSNSIRIEIPASLNSNSSSSNSSRSSNLSSSSNSSRSSNLSSSSSLTPETANDLIFSLRSTQGVVTAIPGE